MLDGGALLQCTPWTRRANYERLMHSVHRLCDKEVYRKAIIIFDGYRETSTKDMMHLRQTKGKLQRM